MSKRIKRNPNKNTYIIDIKALIEDFGGDRKTKTNALEKWAQRLSTDKDTLEDDIKIRKPVIRPELAMKLAEGGMSEYYFDFRTLLYLLSVTGTTIFRTNDKIVLATMAFEYPDIMSWSDQDIYDYVKDSLSNCKLKRIQDALKNTDLFIFNTDGTYSLNMHGLCQIVNARKKNIDI